MEYQTDKKTSTFIFEKVLIIKHKAKIKKKNNCRLITIKTLINQNYLSKALLKYLF